MSGDVMPNFSFVNYGESYIRTSTQRTLFFTEEFTQQSCMELTAMLMYLDSVNSQLITIYINSPGGDTSALINAFDILGIIKSPVRTICIGQASSAAAVLLAAGQPGERYAMGSSEIMIHGVQFIFPLPGMTMDESDNKLAFLKKHNQDIIKMLAKLTKKKTSEVMKDCQEDKYMSPEQAKKYGIIDHII